MNLKNLKSLFEKLGCQRVLVKQLAPNDNSKNQVYLGGSFEILNLLPIKNIVSVSAGDWKRERFKASLDFTWITPEATESPAPLAQLILYPKYPEVRFSGFLIGSRNAPSSIMASRTPGRLLFLSVSNTGKVYGYAADPNDSIAREFRQEKTSDPVGVFQIIDLAKTDAKKLLLDELKRINSLDWIKSKRLDGLGNINPCDSSNCGGYTLEAELGIKPNGFSDPDFHGWEVKQFGVSKLEKPGSKAITLMTPEPTNGVYTDHGVEHFIRTYGYRDKKGREHRLNFGGVHKQGVKHPTTKLTLQLQGYNADENKIRTDGYLALVDSDSQVAASWSFASMMLHWNKKHNQACYVPSITRTQNGKEYKYGSKILLCEQTGFDLFLKQVYQGNVYYDPGIKLENENTSRDIKRRSQFRIKSSQLHQLYKNNELIDLL